jgi:hypothetical protein
MTFPHWLFGCEVIASREWLTPPRDGSDRAASPVTGNAKQLSNAVSQTLNSNVLVSHSARYISTYIAHFAKRSLCGSSKA